MTDLTLRIALERSLDELPLWIHDLEDAVAVENILLELQDDLRALDGDEAGFGPKPLDVLLAQVSGLDPEAARAAVELSELAAAGSYGALSEDACAHGTQQLEIFSGCLQAWVAAQPAA